jgi:hypothetical protein
MVTGAVTKRELEFRQEAMVEETDGVFYLTLHGGNDNGDTPLKRPFNPHGVNGIDDGDPHFVYGG